MDKRKNLALLGEAIGHGAHDAWYGVAPILLASLSGTMRLSNQDIALMLLLYQLLSSLTQPFFGRLSERIGGRPLAVIAICWTTAMFMGTLFAESKFALAAFILLAGLGSGAWHPQGTTNATLAGGSRWGATAVSVFFVGGTAGSAFLGAALGGALLAHFGRQGLLVVAAITVLLALTVVRRWVPRWLPVAEGPGARASLGKGGAGKFRLLLIVLLATLALRAMTQNSLHTFVPKQQEDLGVASDVYGAIISLHLAASAVGAVLGSYLADRIGLRNVLFVSMAVGAALLFAYARLGGWVSYVAFVLAGFAYGPSHTLLIVAGQRRFPDRLATMTGFLLGFTFVSGAGGTLVLGVIADRLGLETVMGYLPWLLALAALLGLVAVPRPEVEGAPVAVTVERV